MQNTNGNTVNAITCSSESSTGPGAEAITGVGVCGIDPANGPDSSATVTMTIRHNQVIIASVLTMGGKTTISQRVVNRRRGAKGGWVSTTDKPFRDDSQHISSELAEVADRLPFPFAVADMLPGTRASAAAVALAAQEVARG